MMITCKEECRELTLSDLKPTKQYAVLHKGGSYSFQSDKPVGDDVVACFDLERSEKPLSEDFFDENRRDDKQMKTYNTYQEAKIANPECEIVTTSPSWDGAVRCIGTFEPLKAYGPRHFVGGNAWVKCNPSDYCMTVGEFLEAGYEFEIGDLVFNKVFDKVDEIDCEKDVDDYNVLDENDKNRYVLRAAVLDGPNRTPSIHADSEFYKKPRTKVEYVKVEDSIFDLRPDFEAGELFYRLELVDEVSFHVIESMSSLLIAASDWNLYRRIETEIDERQEFIDTACDEVGATLNSSAAEGFARLYDSGKFKLVN